MNTTITATIAAFALLLTSAGQSPAVEGQALQMQGTNLVLSWPSPGGYQEYLIQYRQTLDPSTPWTALTNNYFANSTNRTTCTVLSVVLPPASTNGGGGTNFNAPPLPMSATAFLPTGAMTARADGTGSIVPLVLYPPGFDLSGFLIYDPAVSNWLTGSACTRPARSINSLQAPQRRDGPTPDGPGPGGDDPPNSGFYRVFHIPDWSFNVTNYTYDGPWFFPVDFADYMDRVEDFQLLLDGEQSEYAEFMSYVLGNGQTNWGMGIYFDRIPNGNHTIQLVCPLRLNDAGGEDTVYVALSNKVRTITVNNQITFTNWNDAIQSDSYTFDAKIVNSNSDWWIDIYDVWGNYVNTGSGHTTNGQITWSWDLTDYLSNSRTDFDSDPWFESETTFYPAGSGQPVTMANPLTVDGYPNVGEWVTSFQDRWHSDTPAYPPDWQSIYETGLSEVHGGPLLKGDTAWWIPIKFGTNVYSQAEREASWANLKSWISSPWVRNWYYFGHGGTYGIGADRHTLDTNGFVVGSAFTSAASKSRLQSWQIAKAVRQNRYRFVFLDGCDTALGNWPETFSISKTNRDLSFYQNDPKHRRPSAFIGWGTEPGGEGWGTMQHYWDFRDYWMGFWANSIWEPLHDALDDGCRYSNWIDLNKFWTNIRLYGYTVMQMEDYNHKPDWQYP